MARFWVAPRALIFIPQVKIAKTRQLNLLTQNQSASEIFKKQIDNFACFTFVQAKFIEQGFC
ncbi:uncharacterized protein METZ01_LOCUS204750, partial [marine metagenome]